MKHIMTLIFAGIFSLGIVACDDGKAENAGERIDNGIEETRDAIDDAADETSDAVEDACEEVSDENC